MYGTVNLFWVVSRGHEMEEENKKVVSPRLTGQFMEELLQIDR